MAEDKFLYRDFLKKKSTYNLSQGYWTRMFKAHLDLEPSRYNRMFENMDVNGNKIYDGNPVFTFVDLRTRRAVRIIQTDSSERDLQIIRKLQFWWDTYSFPAENEFHLLDEIVIGMYLTSESSKLAISILQMWLRNEEDSNSLLMERIANRFQEFNEL